MKVTRTYVECREEEMTQESLRASVADAECISTEADAIFDHVTVTQVSPSGPLYTCATIEFTCNGLAYDATYALLYGENEYDSDEPLSYVSLTLDSDGYPDLFRGRYFVLMDNEPDCVILTAADGTPLTRRALAEWMREIGIFTLMA